MIESKGDSHFNNVIIFCTICCYDRHLLRTRIFRVEIPAFFLGDFTNMCLHCVSVMDDVTQIIELLDILSTCNRFDLTICFTTKDEQLVREQLFQQLRLKERSQLVSLAAKYRID